MTSLRIYDPIDFDEWFPEEILPISQQHTGIDGVKYQNGKIAEGQRNSYLTSLAGTMRRRDMSHPAIEAALLVENQERCIPPLPEEEVRGRAKSIMRYPPASGSDTDAGAPFPFEALPPALKAMADELSDSLPIAKELVACAGLAVAAGAIGNSRRIEVKKGWSEPAIVTMALVNPPGQMKTPSLAKMAKPLQDLQKEAANMYYREMEQYDKDLEAYGIAKSAAGKKGAGEIPPKPKKPIMLRFTTVDVTVEKLAVLLHENPRGIAVIRDELSGWVQSMNQYKGGKGADKSFWLSAWAGASHTVDRQGKDPIFVDHPAVSVVGNIPTAILGKLNMDSQDDGFLHRILFCNPDPVKVRWSDKSVSDETLTAYHDSIEQLSKLELNIIGDEDDTERSEPVLMPLTAEAQQLFKLWHDAHYARSEEDTFNDGLSGFYHKLKGYCARFALIHQLLVNPKAETIGKASVGFGCDVADFFAGQAEKVFPELMQVSDSFEMKCEINIINSLRKHKSMTKRDLQRNGNAPARIFNSVLLELKEAGVVQEEGKFLTLADD